MSTKRTRVETKRFGEVGQLDLSESFDDILNLADDSMEDKTFVPPDESSPRLVYPLSKKIKAEALKNIDFPNLDDEWDSDNSSNTQSNLVSNVQPNNVQLVSGSGNTSVLPDHENTSDQKTAQHETCVSQSGNDPESSNHENTSNQKNPQHEISFPESDIAKELLDNEKFPEPNLIEPQNNNMEHDILTICKTVLLEQRETLARISLIENAMLKNGYLVKPNGQATIVKNAEDLKDFMVSNHLPLKNAEYLLSFEKKLDVSEFEKIAVNLI